MNSKRLSAQILAALAFQSVRESNQLQMSRHGRTVNRSMVMLVIVLAISILFVSSVTLYAVSYQATNNDVAQVGAVSPGATLSDGNNFTADQELRKTAARDRVHAEMLSNAWTPQISSLRNGTVSDGTVYDAAMILSVFTRLKQRYPQAILVSSDDYSSFSAHGFWVVLVPPAYQSPSQANAWCDSQALAPEDCFAKFLSHDSSPDGAAVLR